MLLKQKNSWRQKKWSPLNLLTMKLDILVFAAHPDDAELGCGGTIVSEVKKGRKVGIVDLTRGELGTRGTVELREQEAANSSEVLGVSVRENLGFKDGFFMDDPEHQLEVIKKIRQYQPEIVIANAISDRHPDHPRSSRLVTESVFKAGLAKVETQVDTKNQEAWRPSKVYHYIQSWHLKPDFIVDVSETWEKKIESIGCYKSQFHDPDSQEPDTFISSPEFLKLIEARAKEYGSLIGVKYGEGFTVERTPGVSDLAQLL